MALQVDQWKSSYGEVEYSASFSAIVRNSLEKILSPMVFNKIITELYLAKILPDTTWSIADIASDDGSTLINILKKINIPHKKFDIFAIDNKEHAINSFIKNVQKKFDKSVVNSIHAIQGDAFSGKIAQLMRISKSIHIGLVSHLMYNVEQIEIDTLVQDIAQNILNQNGICFFLHIKAGDHIYLRRKYGSRAEKHKHAHAKKIYEPVTAISHAAKKLNIIEKSLSYQGLTYFDPMTEQEWELIKDPNNFAKFANNQNVIDNILRISFMAFQTPQSMVMADKEKSWHSLVQDTYNIIKKNSSPQHPAGYLDDTVTLQILIPNNTSCHIHKIDSIFEKISSDIPSLFAAAEKEFISKKTA